ncbi:hypothetical protein C8Q73DRAFT_794366 [Cubamyces lactineus]|nr:hypothetical protein C8Q73DRAFT_794366 [Cubamyces lactineus]
MANGHGESFSTANENADGVSGSSQLSSVGTPESPRLGAERRADLTYSQVAASRPPTPSHDVGPENDNQVARNIFVPHDPLRVNQTPAGDVAEGRRVTVEEVTDEEDSGPWITVQRRRRTRSTGSMPNGREASARQHPRLSQVQQDAVRRAEEKLSPAERERIARRMEVSVSARRRADSESSDSRGEGPSDPMRKGKTVDARNWGAVGIPEEELDPEAQRRELEQYSGVETTSKQDILKGFTTHELQEMLEHWRAHKSARFREQSSPGIKGELQTPALDNGLTPGAIGRAPSVLPDPDSEALCENQSTDNDHATDASGAPVHDRTTGPNRPAPVNGSMILEYPNTVRSPGKMNVRPPVRGKKAKGRQASLRPAAQIEPGSYLGRAFEHLIGGGDPGDFSSSSDGDSSDGLPRR